jgi:hypothetical protein
MAMPSIDLGLAALPILSLPQRVSKEDVAREAGERNILNLITILECMGHSTIILLTTAILMDHLWSPSTITNTISILLIIIWDIIMEVIFTTRANTDITNTTATTTGDTMTEWCLTAACTQSITCILLPW